MLIPFVVAPLVRIHAPLISPTSPSGGDALPASSHAPRSRRTFSKLEKVLDVPNLIDIQKASFRWFMGDPAESASLAVSGLRETIDDISPIRDYSERLEVRLGEYTIGDPVVSERECREKDQSFEVPVNVKVSFTNLDTGEIREQTVFLGNFPWMTEQGTFIINGTERVVVTQLVRSPGAYIMEPKDATKQVFVANLMPSRGSWLEIEIDKKGMVNVRIDRKRKLPVTTLLRALPETDENTGFHIDKTDEGMLALFGDNPFIRMTLEKDPSKREEEALIEVFKKQRPGEPPTLENSRNLVRALFFDPKRYDLTKVGRYKLNMRLGLDVAPECRVLTTGDIVELVRRLVDAAGQAGRARGLQGLRRRRDRRSRASAVEHDLDEYEHFGNRRLRTVGELIQEAFRIGLYRMERVVRERLTTEDEDAITPQTIVNIRPVAAALKEFFGSSQLSPVHGSDQLAGRPHAPAPPVGARRRRPHPRARADRGARRAPDPLRPHVPDRDPGRPEHRPDRLARLLRQGVGARLRADAVPQGRQAARSPTTSSTWTRSRRSTTRSPRRTPRSTRTASSSRRCCAAPATACPSRSTQPQVDYMDVDPAQIVSVATALIPFLEHNDANRALMGSNMQRQAVPLMVHRGAAGRHRPGVPRGGRHRRRRAGRAGRQGRVRRRRADRGRGQGRQRLPTT